MDSQKLRRVKQFANENPAFSEGSLRYLIFDAANNGLDEFKAIIRINGAVYIDPDGFNAWLESKAGKPRIYATQ